MLYLDKELIIKLQVGDYNWLGRSSGIINKGINRMQALLWLIQLYGY